MTCTEWARPSFVPLIGADSTRALLFQFNDSFWPICRRNLLISVFMLNETANYTNFLMPDRPFRGLMLSEYITFRTKTTIQIKQSLSCQTSSQSLLVQSCWLRHENQVSKTSLFRELAGQVVVFLLFTARCWVLMYWSFI